MANNQNLNINIELKHITFEGIDPHFLENDHTEGDYIENAESNNNWYE